MAVRFPGNGGIRFAPGAWSGDALRPGIYAALFKRNATGSWQALLCVRTSAGGERADLIELNPGDDWAFWNGTGGAGTTGDLSGSVAADLTDTDDFVLVVKTWAGTNAANTVRYHWKVGEAGAWNHASLADTSGFGPTFAATDTWVMGETGGGADDLSADVTIWGAKSGVTLDDAAVEATFAAAFDGPAAWDAYFTGPNAVCHGYDDTSARTDRTGNGGDEVARTAALTLVADPAGWSWDAGGTTHETVTWSSSYQTSSRLQTSWQSAYTARERRQSAWRSSYVTHAHQQAAWASGYIVKAHRARTWQSSYGVAGRGSAAWSSAYAVRNRAQAAWASTYTVKARASTSWRSSYRTVARSGTAWASSFVVNGHVTTSWASAYAVQTPGLQHETTTWRSSWTTRARVTATWASGYGIAGRASATWRSRYVVRSRIAATWQTGFTVRAHRTGAWHSSYAVNAHPTVTWRSSYRVGSVEAPLALTLAAHVKHALALEAVHQHDLDLAAELHDTLTLEAA